MARLGQDIGEVDARRCYATAVHLIAAVLIAIPLAADATGRLCQQPTTMKDQPVHWVKGLQIMTEVESRTGRYQGRKEIVSFSPSGGMRIDYTYLSPKATVAKTATRIVSGQDLDAATIYDQSFDGSEIKPSATALGTSGAVLRSLKQTGSAAISIHSLTGDAIFPGQLTLAEPHAVYLPVIVNDIETELPALHVRGSFGTLSGEFWLLDDVAASLTLMYHLVGASPDWQDLRVTEIIIPGAAETTVRRTLSKVGCIAFHDINFDFDKADLRPNARPSMAAVAVVLRTQPSWHVKIAGYTDSVGLEQHNQTLSQERALAVMTDLVTEYGIDPGRLTAVGFGAHNFIKGNDTVVGRALNRRVEVLRISP